MTERKEKRCCAVQSEIIESITTILYNKYNFLVKTMNEGFIVNLVLSLRLVKVVRT